MDQHLDQVRENIPTKRGETHAIVEVLVSGGKGKRDGSE